MENSNKNKHANDHPFGPKFELLAKAYLSRKSKTWLAFATVSGDGVNTSAKKEEEDIVELYALGGSILDFKATTSPEAGCIVNAANSGGITGFGVDERINRAAGNFEIKQARRALGGIPTGTAKYTLAYDHSSHVKYIVHACGPVLRSNSLQQTEKSLQEKYKQVSQAYHAALDVAINQILPMVEINMPEDGDYNGDDDGKRCHHFDVAFCLISAGVFRGEETSLNTVIRLGLEGIENFFLDNTKSEQMRCCRIILVAFTKEEQTALAEEFSKKINATTM